MELESIMRWALDWREFKNFGWNPSTLSFAGTVFFAIWGTKGLLDQNNRIWSNPEQKGEIISVPWFIMHTFTFSSLIIYGISTKGIALVFNGILRTLLHISIIWGLWKFKGYTSKEKALFLTLAGCLMAMLILPWKWLFFMAFTLGGIGFSTHQPREIRKNKSVGLLSIKLIWIYITGASFWLVYSFKFGDRPLQIIMVLYFIVYVITIGLWFRYRKPKPHLTLVR